jgi:hypothetical protein
MKTTLFGGNMKPANLMKHATLFNIVRTLNENILYTATQYRVHTYNTSRTIPTSGFRGALRTIANYLVKIVVPPLTANMELEELSPLLV